MTDNYTEQALVVTRFHARLKALLALGERLGTPSTTLVLTHLQQLEAQLSSDLTVTGTGRRC